MSSAITNVNISIDSALKNQADELFAKLGLDFSTAVDILVRHALCEGKVPFEYDYPKEETIEAMREAERIARDPNVKSYTDVNELFRALDDDD
ncbi:MAG: type II toxin-antitoxin system RelB/DinJ family antitoxin [Candidatus Bruticola sp.]